MCVTISYKGVRYDELQDFRKAIGDDALHVAGQYPLSIYSKESCLCPVDIFATAVALGCEAIRQDDPMHYLLEEQK